MNQDDLFATSEADRFWQRNSDALSRWDPATDPPCQLLRDYGLKPGSVVEIGAADGFRLAYLRREYGASVTGIDPSVAAVAHGLAQHEGVRMLVGTAADVPWQEPAVLVIMNFVLHWVDRRNLLRSLAEADRLVQDGGFLILGDFAPVNYIRTAYHHRPKAWTYKQDYAAIFRASGLYHAVGYRSGGHDAPADPMASEHKRIGAWLLRKQLTEHYTDYAAGGGGIVQKG